MARKPSYFSSNAQVFASRGGVSVSDASIGGKSALSRIAGGRLREAMFVLLCCQSASYNPRMSRYIKKFKSTIALGPTEERGFALWVGYEIEGVDGDVSGMVNVDDWSFERLGELGVTAFTRVEIGDVTTRKKLGIG